jgi:hypothetical protein
MGRNLIFFRRTLLQTFWSFLLLKKCESDLTQAGRIKVKSGSPVPSTLNFSISHVCNSRIGFNLAQTVIICKHYIGRYQTTLSPARSVQELEAHFTARQSTFSSLFLDFSGGGPKILTTFLLKDDHLLPSHPAALRQLAYNFVRPIAQSLKLVLKQQCLNVA